MIQRHQRASTVETRNNMLSAYAIEHFQIRNLHQTLLRRALQLRSALSTPSTTTAPISSSTPVVTKLLV